MATRRTSASNPGRGTAPMVNEPLARLFWRALDRLDYWLTQARLWAVDAVYGPEPETAADRWRASDRERLLRAFRRLDRELPPLRRVPSGAPADLPPSQGPDGPRIYVPLSRWGAAASKSRSDVGGVTSRGYHARRLAASCRKLAHKTATSTRPRSRSHFRAP